MEKRRERPCERWTPPSPEAVQTYGGPPGGANDTHKSLDFILVQKKKHPKKGGAGCLKVFNSKNYLLTKRDWK